MAKRRKEKLDGFIKYNYNNGILQSAIIHLVFLFILSLIGLHTECIKLDPILIQFSDVVSDDIILEPIPAISLDFDTIQEETHAANYKTITPDYEVPAFNLELGSVTSDTINEISKVSPEELMSEIIDAPDEETKNTTTQNTVSKSLARKRFDSFLEGGSLLGNGAGSGQMTPNNIEKRLEYYGAKTGDVQISLIWNTTDDIDLHVTYVNNIGHDTIWFQRRVGTTKGVLDIDMNARGPSCRYPIENIFWPYTQSPPGLYIVKIHFFRAWTRLSAVPVTIRIKNHQGISYHTATAILGREPLVVASFNH